METKTLLIVDDDDVLRSQLSRALITRGFNVIVASNSDEACDRLDSDAPDFAIVDLKMPGVSGLELLKEIKVRSPGTRAVVLTGYGSIANAVEAVRLGAVNYVTKPADVDQILQAFGFEQTDDEVADADGFQRPSLAETEWNHIQQVLADCDGNITHAARILDIPRRTLQRKLRKRAP